MTFATTSLLAVGDSLGLDPALVWGLFSRALGLVFVVVFVSLAPQVRPIAGRRGLTPAAELFAAMRRDFAAPRRWLAAPSLLWLSPSDAMLVALPWLGALAGVAVMVGGPQAPWALLACWALLLSLDRAMTLVYPWDSLLLEAGFWAVFLPATVWGGWSATAAPAPELAWLFRLLVFRVIFGFGKQKFLGSKRSDSAFLQGFLIRQPLPTSLGWRMHHAPLPLLKLALVALFVIEVPLPFLVFVPGDASLVFAASCAALMVAIAATGNYGHFNGLTLVLLLPLLDNVTPMHFALTDFFAGLFDVSRPPAELALAGLIALHTAGALLLLPLNTWASFTWTQWAFWRRLPRALTWPTLLAPALAIFRALQPWRWLHAYGVFPPRAGPAVRMAPRLEVQFDNDGQWHAWRPHIFPTHEDAAPRWVAPHHPRFDQAIIYESVGFTEASTLRNLTGRFDPYGHTRLSAAGALLRGVLTSRIDHAFFFADTPGLKHGGKHEPPTAARVRAVMLEPTTPSERRQSGGHRRKWWRATEVGPHLSAMQADNPSLRAGLPPPELWHPEDRHWQSRSRLDHLARRVCLRAKDREHVHSAVLEGLDDEGTSNEHVEAFWSQFVAFVGSAEASALPLHEVVAQVRARFDTETLAHFERLAGRYTLFLLTQLEPLFLAGGLRALLGLRPPALQVENHTQLHHLAAAMLLDGKAAYSQALAEPERARGYIPELASRAMIHPIMDRGARLRAVFRWENTLHQARLFRMLKTQTAIEGRPEKPSSKLASWAAQVARRLWGAFDELDRLAALPTPEDPDMPERWPRFRQRADHSFERVPPPADDSATPSAPATPPPRHPTTPPSVSEPR